MNILHVLDERWDSGLTAYGLGIARVLQNRGHRVWVAARPGGPAARAARDAGFSPAPLGWFAMGRLVRREEIDVVNAHTGAGHTAGFVATRGTAAALVRTRAEARRLVRRVGQAGLFRRTDGFVVASVALREAMAALYPFVRERTRVVYPGLEPFPAVPEPASPRFGVVARLDPVKGHRYVLEAAALLKNRPERWEIVVAGEDQNLTREALRAEAERRGVADRVRFLGRIEDVPGFMASCQVGVVASIDSEAVSRVAMEWMAAGRALVATTVGGLPELIVPGEDGALVPPKSGAALAQTLAALLDDPPTRRRLGEGARRAVAARFGVDRWGIETEAVYERALARRRGGVR